MIVIKNTQTVLDERAVKLAQPLKQEESKAESVEILLFMLSSETYGIESCYLKEIYPLKDFTHIPCVPSFIFGVMNVRRKIITILDLRHIFSLEILPEEAKENVIILEYEGNTVALRADSILNVQTICIDQIQPPPPTLTGLGLEFLKGVTSSGIVILNGNKLLSNKHLIVDESIDN